MKKIVMLFAVMSVVGLHPVGAAPRSTTKSPLLGEYSSFKKDKEDKSMLVYRDKEKKASDYKKFIVDPVLIYTSVHRGGDKLSTDNLQVLAELFRTELMGALKNGYEVTDAAGPGTLRLRFGIRDLKPGKYYLAGKGAREIKPDTDLAEVTFEMEGIDSMTGDRIIAIVRDVHNEEVKGADREKEVKRVSDLFSEWVKLLRNRLDQSNIPK